jgi:hypothetical protein
MNSAHPPSGLKPLYEVRDELGKDRLKAELAAGRWVAYWYDVNTAELHKISQAHWLDDFTARRTVVDGTFVDRRDKTLGPKFHPTFVAPAELESRSTKRHAGGRPVTYDWESVLIHVASFIHENGLPKTQAELVRVMQDWFNERGDIPAESEIKKRARLVLQAFGR